jgi:hypothetical protein
MASLQGKRWSLSVTRRFAMLSQPQHHALHILASELAADLRNTPQRDFRSVRGNVGHVYLRSSRRIEFLTADWWCRTQSRELIDTLSEYSQVWKAMVSFSSK